MTSILRTNGHKVLLGSEENPYYLKNNDCLLNDLPMDIKSIKSCLVIAGDQIVDYLKKATTPSAEWF